MLHNYDFYDFLWFFSLYSKLLSKTTWVYLEWVIWFSMQRINTKIHVSLHANNKTPLKMGRKKSIALFTSPLCEIDYPLQHTLERKRENIRTSTSALTRTNTYNETPHDKISDISFVSLILLASMHTYLLCRQ